MTDNEVDEELDKKENEDPDKEASEGINKGVNEKINKGVNEGTVKEINEGTVKEINERIDKEANESPNKEANKKTDKKKIRKDDQRIDDNQFYLILKDIIIPILILVLSIVAIFQSSQAIRISEQTAQDAKSNNELINNYTVNMNKPTFNFRYYYGESKDVITGLDIENEGTSLSTNTIRIYPYLEILLRNNNSEEDFIQQDDVIFPNKYFYETILVPVESDVFNIEYQNNRTGILATITQNPVYNNLIKEIEDCGETLPGGEKIICIQLKCYMDLNYRDLNNVEMTETEKWNIGYKNKCSESDYYKIKENEDVGVLKIEDTGLGDYKYVTGISTGRFIPNSNQSLIDAIEVNRNTNRTGYITLEVRRLDQQQWSKNVKGEAGDIVAFRIHVDNTTDTSLENWGVRIISPTNTEYIEGRTVVVNSYNPAGLCVSDNIIDNSGINIGNYATGADAYIYFYVRIGEEAQKADKNMIYRVIAQCSAGTITGTIEDYADVLVASE